MPVPDPSRQLSINVQVQHAVEAVVATFPPKWTELPTSGEIHRSPEAAFNRLDAAAFCSGFVVVVTSSSADLKQLELVLP
ncbi:hypothetical protein RUND412_009577 [Rhizina undulata]